MDEERVAMKAIRLKCLDCSGDSAREVEECSVEDCPLYPFRLGKVPEKSRKKKEAGEEPQKLTLPGI